MIPTDTLRHLGEEDVLSILYGMLYVPYTGLVGYQHTYRGEHRRYYAAYCVLATETY